MATPAVASRISIALSYAEQGQPVFPCEVMGKRPATAHGFKDATCQAETIYDWWRAADYNIGLPTGILFDAIDCDGGEGIDSFEDYLEEVSLSLLPTVYTPSGGYHIYVQPTGVGNKAGWLPHVDYRGIGGYVVGAGSVTEKGEYRCRY